MLAGGAYETGLQKLSKLIYPIVPTSPAVYDSSHIEELVARVRFGPSHLHALSWSGRSTETGNGNGGLGGSEVGLREDWENFALLVP